MKLKPARVVICSNGCSVAPEAQQRNQRLEWGRAKLCRPILLCLLLSAPAFAAEDPDLAAQLRSNDAGRRRQAVEQVESLMPQLAAQWLGQAMADSDPAVRSRAALAIGKRQIVAALPPLVDHLSDSDPTVRAAAAEALGQFTAFPKGLGERAAPILIRTLGDGQYEVRLAMIRALDSMVRAQALSPIELNLLLSPVILRVDDDNVGVRRAAVGLLGRVGRLGQSGLTERLLLPLLGRLSDNSRDVRGEALSALATIGAKSAAPAVLRMLRDPAEEVRRQAIHCLGRLGSPDAVVPLTELLATGPEPQRAATALALGRIVAAQKQDGPTTQAALAALLRCLGREEGRPLCREGLLLAGPLAVPATVAALGRPGESTLSEVVALTHLLRDLGHLVPQAQRAPAVSALTTELSRGRVPREDLLAALGQLGDPAVAPLCARLLLDRDVLVRRAAVAVLRRPGILDSRALSALSQATKDSDAQVRIAAINALGGLGLAAAKAPLLALLGRDSATRQAALRALEQIYGAASGPAVDRDVLQALLAALQEGGSELSDAQVRRAASSAMGALAPRAPTLAQQVVPTLTAALRRKGEPPVYAVDVIHALGGVLRAVPSEVGSETLLDLAETRGDAREASLALAALEALGAARDPKTAGRLSRLLNHRDPLRRLRAAFALGCLLAVRPTDALAAPLLSLVGGDPDARVRAEAAWGLGRLAGKASAGLTRRVVAGLRAALDSSRGDPRDGGERANLVAALALLGAAEARDTALLEDPELAVRANAAWLLAGLAANSPGLRARIGYLKEGDASPWVRRAAEQAQKGALRAADRGHFIGLAFVDVDGRPQAESRYRLLTPDLLVRVGLTSSAGTAQEELLQSGACEVEVIAQSR